MDTKVITVRGSTRIAAYDLIEKLFEAFEEGYRPIDRKDYTAKTNPTLINHLKVVTLVKPEVVEKAQVVVEETIEEITTEAVSEDKPKRGRKPKAAE